MEELQLKDVFSAILDGWKVVFLFVILFTALGAGYSYMMKKPMYESTTTVIIKDERAGQSQQTMTANDINLSRSLTTTYTQLIMSDKLMTNVLLDTGIKGMTSSELANHVKVTTLDGTEMLAIKVSTLYPEESSQIANSISKEFRNLIKETYEVDNISPVDVAKPPINPYNVSHIKDLLMFAVLGFVLGLAIVLVRFYLDDTIKTQEEIEEKLGIFVLAHICEANKERDLLTM